MRHDAAAQTAWKNLLERSWPESRSPRLVAMHGFTHQHAMPGAIPGVAYHRLADERSFAATRAFLAETLT